MPRFIRDLFDRLEDKKNNDPGYESQVYVSFLELYNEDLVDLLNFQQRQRGACDISIRQDVQGNIYWSGVREEPCSDPRELLGYLTKGSLGRTVGSTDMNAVSSRSHAIFSVILKQQLPDEDNADQRKTIVSKFHFVDLAGSERVMRVVVALGAFPSTLTLYLNIACQDQCARSTCTRRHCHQFRAVGARQCYQCIRR